MRRSGGIWSTKDGLASARPAECVVLTLEAISASLAFSAASFSAIFIFVIPFCLTGGGGPVGLAGFFSSSESEASHASYTLAQQSASALRPPVPSRQARRSLVRDV